MAIRAGLHLAAALVVWLAACPAQADPAAPVAGAVAVPPAAVSLSIIARSPLGAAPVGRFGAPGRLSLPAMTAGDEPRLAIVLESIRRGDAGEPEMSPGSRLVGRAPDWGPLSRMTTRVLLGGGGRRLVSPRTYVVLGTQALALYSYLHSRDGARTAATAEMPAAAQPADVEAADVRDLPAALDAASERSHVEFAGALAGMSRSRRAPAPTDAAAVAAEVAPATPGLIMRVAHRVDGIIGGLRGLRLNSFDLGDGTRLRLDGRTGRHARFLITLTRRF